MVINHLLSGMILQVQYPDLRYLYPLVINRAAHVSNVQNPVDIPLYWLVDRDPYNGLF